MAGASDSLAESTTREIVRNNICTPGDVKDTELKFTINQDVDREPEKGVVQRLGTQCGEDIDRV